MEGFNMGVKINLIGERFGRLLVVDWAGKTKHGNWKFKCICDCGNETIQPSGTLREGCVVSCGCYNREIRGKSSVTHGLSSTHEYKRWSSMLRRCNCPNQPGYDRYGGIGVTVCDEWQGDGGFINFIEHVGMMPDYEQDWTLERIDPRKNYEPDNVKWLLNEFQPRNKKKSRRNTTGATGVVLEIGERNSVRYRAFWCDLETGKNKSKSFSIKKYGKEEAFRLACEWRTKMIEQLNAQGAGYTETHGQ